MKNNYANASKTGVDARTFVKIMCIVAAIFMIMAPGMTFSKIDVGQMSIKCNMYEMMDLAKVINQNDVANAVGEFYVDNYKEIIDVLEKIGEYTVNAEEIVSTLEEYAPVLSAFPVLGPLVNIIADVGAETVIFVLEKFNDATNETVTILKSDTNNQIVDTIAIATNNRSKLRVMTIILIVLGATGVIFTLLDINIIIAILSAVGVYVSISLVGMFEHIFLSMGIGVYLVAIASIMYFVFGIVGCVQKTKSRV